MLSAVCRLLQSCTAWSAAEAGKSTHLGVLAAADALGTSSAGLVAAVLRVAAVAAGPPLPAQAGGVVAAQSLA